MEAARPHLIRDIKYHISGDKLRPNTLELNNFQSISSELIIEEMKKLRTHGGAFLFTPDMDDPPLPRRSSQFASLADGSPSANANAKLASQ